ncbi:hypothetical protein MJO29_012758 [Puccinia striiformis f. sp. tritici]|nr:hypothetical protein MJO29_012758 [Puccinia striiformis f. sp. tritici]KAI9606665.1 hypothetical protein H4Q26_006201 [Puccinia striiformis f. sp. tritici PST-130]KAI9614484.1 hypothetical protein KEM48_006059 [Puccinia striiformis f. sp. tritici PST-130]
MQFSHLMLLASAMFFSHTMALQCDPGHPTLACEGDYKGRILVSRSQDGSSCPGPKYWCCPAKVLPMLTTGPLPVPTVRYEGCEPHGPK